MLLPTFKQTFKGVAFKLGTPAAVLAISISLLPLQAYAENRATKGSSDR